MSEAHARFIGLELADGWVLGTNPRMTIEGAALDGMAMPLGGIAS